MQSRTFSGLGINVSLCFLHLTTKVFHLMLTVHLILFGFIPNLFLVESVILFLSYITSVMFSVVCSLSVLILSGPTIPAIFPHLVGRGEFFWLYAVIDEFLILQFSMFTVFPNRYMRLPSGFEFSNFLSFRSWRSRLSRLRCNIR